MQNYPKHYCGVFGIFGHPNAAELTYYGLYALQHRGQESAGIVMTKNSEHTAIMFRIVLHEILRCYSIALDESRKPNIVAQYFGIAT